MKKIMSFIMVLAFCANTMAITTPNILRVKLTSANNKSDEVILYQADDADDTQLQNGKDATKIDFPMNEPAENVYIYVTRTYDKPYNLASMYVTDLTGQYITIKTNATETSYKFTFPTVYPATFSVKILDWETNVVTDVTPGASYAFTATANTIYANRFQIIPTYTVTTNINGWATYSNSLDLQLEESANATLLKGALAGDVLNLTPVTYAAANEGVVVKGDPSTTYTLVPMSPIANEFTGNDLKASVTETTLDATNTNYCLTTINGYSAFYEYTGAKVSANKAYLAVSGTAAPRRIRMIVEGTTDVENVEAEVAAEKVYQNGQLLIKKGNRLYNLQGQIVK